MHSRRKNSHQTRIPLLYRRFARSDSVSATGSSKGFHIGHGSVSFGVWTRPGTQYYLSTIDRIAAHSVDMDLGDHDATRHARSYDSMEGKVDTSRGNRLNESIKDDLSDVPTPPTATYYEEFLGGVFFFFCKESNVSSLRDGWR
jgi:hypothetical protein